MPDTVYTIGHSNRTLDDFLRLLFKYEIEFVADVRRYPRSRYRHFNKEELEKHLSDHGIGYGWFESLGGYRRSKIKDSPHVAIRSHGFRSYADHMMSDEFRYGVERLMEICRVKRVALMCAERFFWRCHRKFISDYLVVRGFRVLHILNDKLREHKLSKEARVVNEIIIYDVIEKGREVRSQS